MGSSRSLNEIANTSADASTGSGAYGISRHRSVEEESFFFASQNIEAKDDDRNDNKSLALFVWDFCIIIVDDLYSSNERLDNTTTTTPDSSMEGWYNNNNNNNDDCDTSVVAPSPQPPIIIDDSHWHVGPIDFVRNFG
jgi:hypothetical protein